MSKPKKPEGLADAGAALWKSIADAQYELRADELRVLEDACRTADLIEDLRLEALDAQRIVKGSQGQPVINPLISELRQYRSTLASLLRQLHLPDEGGVSPSDKSSAAGRALVSNRWHKRA